MAQVSSSGKIGGANGEGAYSFALGTLTANSTQTSHADVSGLVSRLYVAVNNGASNSVVWGVEGSADGTNWFPIAWRQGTGTYATTDRTTTAGTKEAVFLSGPDTPRYVRVDVTTGNANGSAFTLHGER